MLFAKDLGDTTSRKPWRSFSITTLIFVGADADVEVSPSEPTSPVSPDRGINPRKGSLLR